jgi:DNA-binding IclR family transcriptional regulator
VSVQADQRKTKTRYSIEAVGKAVDILQVFIDEKWAAISFTEIATRVRLSKNGVFRLLATLTEKGFLQKVPENGKYALSLKCVQLGRAARLANDIRRVALPYMLDLRAEFEETVNLAVLDEGRVCYTEVLESPQRFKLVTLPGDRDPVHCTALGKAMMAYVSIDEVKKILKEHGMPRMTPATITTWERFEQELAKIRKQGYAVNNSEMIETSRCVAVPILNDKGRPMAALSVSGTTTRIIDAQVAKIAESLRRFATEISKHID